MTIRKANSSTSRKARIGTMIAITDSTSETTSSKKLITGLATPAVVTVASGRAAARALWVVPAISTPQIAASNGLTLPVLLLAAMNRIAPAIGATIRPAACSVWSTAGILSPMKSSSASTAITSSTHGLDSSLVRPAQVNEVGVARQQPDSQERQVGVQTGSGGEAKGREDVDDCSHAVLQSRAPVTRLGA